MRAGELDDAVVDFAEQASQLLAGELAAGAEVAFELEGQRARGARRGRGGGPVLYAYRALTGEFIAERLTQLERLPAHARLVSMLEGFDGLDAYLAAVGAKPARIGPRARSRAAIAALLRELFEEQSDFELRPERLRVALGRLRAAALSRGGQTSLLATLHGLTIASPELRLAGGLTIAAPQALEGLPEDALADDDEGPGHLVVLLTAGAGEPRGALAHGRAVMGELLRALRLFGDGRVTLGGLGWVRVESGRWTPVVLGSGGRPHGMLAVTSEHEDELRAFCNLVSRRAPHGNELAWALRRFELGCERACPLEALSDHLLALRALLEPEGAASGLLPARLAALCATPEERSQLRERVRAALELERAVVEGAEVSEGAAHALAAEIADHLRALLRDVICGHLDARLVELADELLLAPTPEAQEPSQLGPLGPGSVEHVLGDPSEAGEVLDVFI